MLGVALRILTRVGARVGGRTPRPAPRPAPRQPGRPPPPRPQPGLRPQPAGDRRTTRVAVGPAEVHVSVGRRRPAPHRPDRRPAGATGAAPAGPTPPAGRRSAAAVVVPGPAPAGPAGDRRPSGGTARRGAAPTGRDGGRRRPAGRVFPWQVPVDGAGSTGRIVVRPSFLHELQRVFTGHLATADEVDRLARRQVDLLDVDDLVVAGDLEQAVRRRARDAVEDGAGTRRLPPLLARDVGYVVQALARAQRMDAHDAFGPRAVAGLVATLAPGTSPAARGRVRRWLTALEPRRSLPTTPARASGGRTALEGCVSGGGAFAAGGGRAAPPPPAAAPADAAAVLGVLVAPFLAGRGLTPVPLEAGGAGRQGVGCAASDGGATARAVASELGIPGWRENSYQSFVTEVGGARCAVQVLWGAEIGHGDWVAVLCRPA